MVLPLRPFLPVMAIYAFYFNWKLNTAMRESKQRIEALIIAFPDFAVLLDPAHRFIERRGFECAWPALRVLAS